MKFTQLFNQASVFDILSLGNLPAHWNPRMTTFLSTLSAAAANAASSSNAGSLVALVCVITVVVAAAAVVCTGTGVLGVNCALADCCTVFAGVMVVLAAVNDVVVARA
jgi:hypothetical protein